MLALGYFSEMQFREFEASTTSDVVYSLHPTSNVVVVWLCWLTNLTIVGSPNSDVILAVHADLSDLTKNGMLFIHVDIVQFAIDAEITF